MAFPVAISNRDCCGTAKRPDRPEPRVVPLPLLVQGVYQIMHEQFDHTADLGLRVRSPDLNTLFAEAAECLYSAFVEDLSTIHPVEECAVEIVGNDLVYLLFDWLKELLYRFDGDGMLFGKYEVHVRENGLSARVWGEPFDPTRHPMSREVKAITYHDLIVEKSADGWLAEVIVDI